MDQSHRKVYETLLKKWSNHCYECNGDSQQLNQIDHWCQILSDEEDTTKVEQLLQTTQFLTELRHAEFYNKNPIGQTKQSC